MPHHRMVHPPRITRCFYARIEATGKDLVPALRWVLRPPLWMQHDLI